MIAEWLCKAPGTLVCDEGNLHLVSVSSVTLLVIEAIGALEIVTSKRNSYLLTNAVTSLAPEGLTCS